MTTERVVHRILVVDDEPAILRAVRHVFVEDGEIEVLTATSGQSALELLEEQRIDLVLSDLLMPGMDGIALLREVKQLFPRIPRMLISGAGDAGARALEALGEKLPLVTKPWDRAELQRTVHDLLVRSQLGPEEAALVHHAGVSLVQLERARRVRARLQRDRPLGEILVELGELTQESHEHAKRMRRSRMSLVDLLREDGLLDDAAVERYQKEQRQHPERDDRLLLVEGGLVSEEQYLRALCTRMQLVYAEPEVGVVDTRLLEKTSIRYLLRQHALPVHVLGGKLVVVVADPTNREALAELQRIYGQPLELHCCVAAKIAEALRTLERLRGGGDDSGSPAIQYREIAQLPEGDANSHEAVHIVDYLLGRAIQLGASDLHIEPLQTKIRVRVRVDGVLQQLTDLPIDFAPQVISRIKILAGADISEKRLHQDGKICVKAAGSEVDIRVSCYVSVHGECIVMRLLDRNRGVPQLDAIGFTPRAYAALDEVVLQSSSGLVLLVGPTGSGKTTTLYSFVAHANDPREKVITCEDPVEFVIDGIIQCSVNQKTGPTFADSLRAIVRQDPETIVVGEIRDRLTAELALEAALTGHKVFSTFHTEDSLGAFVRLLEMGTEPFLVASTVSGVVAQRLMRRLCSRCRRVAEPDRKELAFLGLERKELQGTALYTGVGCADCSGSGYKGRLAIHEVLLPDDDFRDAVLRRASSKELREQARKLNEFLTLQEDGVLKALDGRTSLSEVIANAPRDTAARPLAVLRTHAHPGRRR